MTQYLKREYQNVFKSFVFKSFSSLTLYYLEYLMCSWWPSWLRGMSTELQLSWNSFLLLLGVIIVLSGASSLVLELLRESFVLKIIVKLILLAQDWQKYFASFLFIKWKSLLKILECLLWVQTLHFAHFFGLVFVSFWTLFYHKSDILAKQNYTFFNKELSC